MVADADRVFTTPKYCEIAVGTGDFGDWRSFLTYLRGLFGSGVVVLDVPQSSFYEHPDMYLTPIGDHIVMLGDPGLAAEIVRRALPESLRHFAKRLASLGHEHAEHEILGRATPEFLMSSLPIQDARSRATERLSRQLILLGYRVVRVPWLSFRFPGTMAEFRFSYNNVILENRDGRRIVYLPAYGIPALDAAAQKIWSQQGFQVVSIDALGPAIFGGAVRCLSQVFRRTKKQLQAGAGRADEPR